VPSFLDEHDELIVLDREEHAVGAVRHIEQSWRQCHEAGHTYAVVFFEWDALRTLRQNQWYFGDLREISAQAWLYGRRFTVRAWHEHFRRKFLGWEEDSATGLILPFSTRKLPARRFHTYHQLVIAEAVTELDVVFP
jgi:hypothetical protein